MKTIPTPDIVNFVASFSPIQLNLLYKAYSDGCYDDLLPAPHKYLTEMEQRMNLIRYLSYYLFENGASDLTERGIVLTDLVLAGDADVCVSRITQEQFYEEPLFRMI